MMDEIVIRLPPYSLTAHVLHSTFRFTPLISVQGSLTCKPCEKHIRLFNRLDLITYIIPLNCVISLLANKTGSRLGYNHVEFTLNKKNACVKSNK